MKRLLSSLLSKAAVCAFLSATPVVAQETITGAPRGTAPITAEPPGPGHDNTNVLGALGAILAAPFDSITSSAANATSPKARCQVTRDFKNSEGRYTTVCSP